MPIDRNTSPSFHGFWISFCLLVSLTLSGCGEALPDTWPTAGRVTFADGLPVTFGTLEFESNEHPYTSRARIDSDGTFRVSTFEEGDGAIAGSHKVILLQMMAADYAAEHSSDHGALVDLKYSSYRSTPLRVQVERTDLNELQLTVDYAAAP